MNEHTHDDHDYDDNANYDDVFDTKHVTQTIDDIHITTNPTPPINSNYKLYFDDEYHDFNQISQKCVDNERVSMPANEMLSLNMQNSNSHNQFRRKCVPYK